MQGASKDSHCCPMNYCITASMGYKNVPLELLKRGSASIQITFTAQRAKRQAASVVVPTDAILYCAHAALATSSCYIIVTAAREPRTVVHYAESSLLHMMHSPPLQ